MKKGIKVISGFFKWLLLALLIIIIVPTSVAISCYGSIDLWLEKNAINCGYKSDEDVARERIYIFTGIEISSDVKILYHLYDDTSGFSRGVGYQYTVFKFENEPIELLNENSFIKGKNTNYESSFLFYLLSEKPDYLEEIPKEYLPNFNEEYYYMYTDDGVHFVYNKQSCLLHVYVRSH